MTWLHWILVPSAWVRHFISLWQQFSVGISFIRHLVHPPQLRRHFSEVSCANIVQPSLPGTQSQNLHAEMKHMFEVNVTNYVTGQHDRRQNETRVWDHCHCDVTGLHDWRQVVRQLLETQCTQSTISSKACLGFCKWTNIGTILDDSCRFWDLIFSLFHKDLGLTHCANTRLDFTVHLLQITFSYLGTNGFSRKSSRFYWKW